MKVYLRFKKWLGRYLSTKRERRYLNKYYPSIKNIPLSVWMDFVDDYDLRKLSLNGKEYLFGNKAYQIYRDELVDYFGISTEYKNILAKKVKIELLWGDVLLKGDKTRMIFIEKLEQELEDIEKRLNESKTDLMASLIAVNSHFSYKLDPKVTTVYEFYKYVKFVTDNKQVNG